MVAGNPQQNVPEALEETILELLEGPQECVVEDVDELLRHWPEAVEEVWEWLAELGLRRPDRGIPMRRNG